MLIFNILYRNEQIKYPLLNINKIINFVVTILRISIKCLTLPLCGILLY